MKRLARPVLPLLIAALLWLSAMSSSAPTSVAQELPGQPGPYNAITDVPGIRVGQVQASTEPYLTGTTLVYTPRMAVTGVDQRGGAPATKETDLLSPLNSNPGVNAIQLGGSSMYGLSATDGVIRWLEDRGEGIPLGTAGVAPIVPAADIFDLGRGGDAKARTTPEWGWLAAEATSDGPVRQGSVGGGTGARAGGLQGGVGTASQFLDDGTWVGALVVVNSVGSPVDPTDCTLLGADLGLGDEFAGLRAPSRQECQGTVPTGGGALNTTVAVVATNAPLDKAGASRLASSAHDGMARAISPIHTLYDGDTVFGVSTGPGPGLSVYNPAAAPLLNRVFAAGANTLSRAIAKAMLAATTQRSTHSYCDTYPSACERLVHLRSWRTAGEAPEVTPASFERASRHLQVTPVPPPQR
jgi:L-aminopeptidase/D-esterase-like protein